MPNSFLQADIIPIPKPNKTPKNIENYRPIALTSCLSKLLERIIINRLKWRLEKDKTLLPHQSGFRTGRNTLDILQRFTTNIQNSLNSKTSTIAVLLDLKSAYNRVDHEKLLQKFIELKIPPCYVNSINNF
jgi:hypothetical protein